MHLLNMLVGRLIELGKLQFTDQFAAALIDIMAGGRDSAPVKGKKQLQKLESD